MPVSETLRIEHAGFISTGGVKLDNFSMSMHKGEIMGLVPVDGYGIDALFELLQSNPPLHYGYVYMREKIVNSWDHRGNKMNRVSIIRGRSALAGKLTVADNVFVLRHGFRKYVIRPEQLAKQLQPFMDEAGVDIPADKYADELSEYERIAVEIIKAAVAGSWLIAIDEPEALVSAADLRRLNDMLGKYSAQGFTILYVSSHYEDLVSLCDRIAIMENGQIIKVFKAGDRLPGINGLITNGMSGYRTEMPERSRSTRRETDSDRKVLTLENVSEGRIYRMNLELAAGQCMLINNIDRREIFCLEGIISGRIIPEGGEVRIDGVRLEGTAGRKIAVIPPEPENTLIYPDMSYMDNLCMTLDGRIKDIWRNGSIRRSLRHEAEKTADPGVFEVPVSLLSAEEKKELVYKRILLQRPQAVMVIQPFRASGIASRRHTADLIRQLLDKGTAVIIVSAGMNDAIMITDDIVQYAVSLQ